MARYAIITPKPDVEAPQNLGMPNPWGFYWDSVWYEIGPGKPLTEDLALHAEKYFSRIDEHGRPDCLVDLDWHEGELQLSVKQPEQTFTCPLCSLVIADYATFSRHIKECAAHGEEKETRAQVQVETDVRDQLKMPPPERQQARTAQEFPDRKRGDGSADAQRAQEAADAEVRPRKRGE